MILTEKQKIVKKLLFSNQITFEEMLVLLDNTDVFMNINPMEPCNITYDRGFSKYYNYKDDPFKGINNVNW